MLLYHIFNLIKKVIIIIFSSSFGRERLKHRLGRFLHILLLYLYLSRSCVRSDWFSLFTSDKLVASFFIIFLFHFLASAGRTAPALRTTSAFWSATAKLFLSWFCFAIALLRTDYFLIFGTTFAFTRTLAIWSTSAPITATYKLTHKSSYSNICIDLCYSHIEYRY